MNNKEPLVILVDEQDNEVGTMPKLKAHQKGLLHRAVSVLIFNSNGEWLLQQRADEKYHSPGLWTNSCCSHPYPNEDVATAASRRLKEELGIQAPLKHLFAFQYRAEFENGLIEHEFDHVFIGMSDAKPTPDPREVKNFNYISSKNLEWDISKNPENYTSWFRILFPEALKKL